MSILSILFFITATIYSSVGFGGGSTYLALLIIWGIPYGIFPLIALSCNIIVVSGNCFNYIRAGNLNFKLLTPYLIGSIPLAFIGGSLPINKEIFELSQDDNVADKGDFKDFMSKEIDEQSISTKKCINEYLDKSRNEINIYNLPIEPKKINKITSVLEKII